MTSVTEHNTEAGHGPTPRFHAQCVDVLRTLDAYPCTYYITRRRAVQWEKRAFKYPDGGREFILRPVSLMPNPQTRRPPRPEAESDDSPGGGRDYGAEAAARAKRKVKRAIRSNRLDHMVTLTFPGGGVHDRDEAQRLVAGFIHHHAELVAGPEGYVSVLEYKPEHGYHLHLARHGRQSMEQVIRTRRLWTRYLAGHDHLPTGGAREVRTNIKQLGSRQAAVYVSKYVSKALDEGPRRPGEHRYEVSEGLAQPVPSLSMHRSVWDALDTMPHPLFWHAFYDGRPEGRPFVWVADEYDP